MEVKDLVVLVADKCAEQAIYGLLSRPKALGTRQVTFDVYVHPDRDPGCLHESHELLRPLRQQYKHALVIFDLEGSGAESKGREAAEEEVRQRLERAGWSGRAKVIAIEPELEVWVWSDSPEVDRCLGWSQRLPPLREWLKQQALWEDDSAKPPRPKETLVSALEEVSNPLSSSIFGELARSVSVNRCTDDSFEALRNALTAWFGQERRA